MSKYILIGDKTELFDSALDIFKKLYKENIFIVEIKDGIIKAKNDKNKEIEYNFGIINSNGTSASLKKEMVEYRNSLRNNMEEMKGVVELTKEQLDKLAKGFAVIKEK